MNSSTMTSSWRLLQRRLFSTTSSNRAVVFVALSGGVDSSVAAALLSLHQQPRTKESTAAYNTSYSLHAIHMSNWNFSDDDTILAEATCQEQDWKDAMAVAQHLQIPLQRQHFERDYWTQVFEPYLNQLLVKGHMGNPDILCNREIKFGVLREHCQRQFGVSTDHNSCYLATGHYARLWHRDDSRVPITITAELQHQDSIHQLMETSISPEEEWLWTWGLSSQHNNGPLLLAARDRSKDQSYFLAGCSSQQLSNVLFPLGHLYKKEIPRLSSNDRQSSSWKEERTVRQLAVDYNLPTATKRESMGICFVGKRRSGFADFVQNYLPGATTPVTFVDVDTGDCVGQTMQSSHAVLYTAGQGARLSGTASKYFVVNHDAATNTVHVCSGTHHPALYSDSLTVDEMNWIVGACPSPLLQPSQVLRCQCRIRHLQPLVDCTVTLIQHENTPSRRIRVDFDRPLRAIMPGQMAVLYAADGLVCLGGGPIACHGASYMEQGKDLITQSSSLHPSGANDLSVA